MPPTYLFDLLIVFPDKLDVPVTLRMQHIADGHNELNQKIAFGMLSILDYFEFGILGISIAK